jgi:hypothetical protein
MKKLLQRNDLGDADGTELKTEGRAGFKVEPEDGDLEVASCGTFLGQDERDRRRCCQVKKMETKKKVE